MSTALTSNPSTPLRTVLYYTNWSIYARTHHPHHLPLDNLSHVLYAFANLDPTTGTVCLSDPWADTDQHYPSDSWSDTGTPNLYGCLKQLFLLKKRKRTLKVLLSIGGWSYSKNFSGPATTTAAGRAEFARSAVQLLEDCGFDGLDVDWEYPANKGEAHNYVLLLGEVRKKLDEAAAKRSTGAKFLLTVACPAGREQYEKWPIKEMDRYLDFWNLMAYDYTGKWCTVAGHASNLFPGKGGDREATPCSTREAVEWYTKKKEKEPGRHPGHHHHHHEHRHFHRDGDEDGEGGGGIHPGKLILGMPLYGYAFVNTAGPGHRYGGGNGNEGSWEAGTWDVKDLPRAGAEEYEDCPDDEVGVGASWSYDPKTKTMVSYDTVAVAARKARYVKERGLGGGMWWESNGDGKGAKSRVSAFVEGIGGRDSLEEERNCLDYPHSRFENLRKGFPGEEGMLRLIAGNMA